MIEEHPDPTAGLGEVLVRVHAAGLNGADMMQKRGLYPAPPGSPQDIPGMEFAGGGGGLGAGASRLRGGRSRDGHRRRGSEAELVSVHERLLMAVPEGLDWAAAGGLPEVFTTAHDAPTLRARPSCARVSSCSRPPGERAGWERRRCRSRVLSARASSRRCAAEELREQVAALGAEVIAAEGFAESTVPSM